MPIYVINKDGLPLMSTNNYGMVKKLLIKKKARVVSKKPFAIQLLYKTTYRVKNIPKEAYEISHKLKIEEQILQFRTNKKKPRSVKRFKKN